MARITSSRNLLKNHVEDYLFKASDQWASLLAGTPFFVTYYSKDRLASTQDAGLDAVVETVGAYSPTEYSKIEDFMIFGLDELTAQIADEGFGVDTTYEGQATVLPDTIKPLTDDYFIITVAKKSWLFRVSDTQVDRVHGKKFWKINFYLSRDSIEMINEQVSGDFTMVPAQNTSVEGKVAVIATTDSILVDQADMLMDQLTRWYCAAFLSPRFNVPIWKENDYNIYDQALAHFIQRTSALYRPGTYRTSAVVEDVLYWSQESSYEYRNTVFWAAENQAPWAAGFTDDYGLLSITKGADRSRFFHTPFSGHWEKYSLAQWGQPNPSPRRSPFPTLWLMSQPGTDLAGADPVLGVVALHIRNEFKLSSPFMDALEELDPTPSIMLFHLLPVALMAIKTERDKVVATQTIK
jgi:hypothetical protein